MSIALTTPVAGLSQTGLTSPTYTIAADTPPDVNAKQWAVTALGGTQTGVTAHSISAPFTGSFFRPKVPASLPSPNPVTGKYGPIPMNRHSYVFRKGVSYAANQSPMVATMRVFIDLPAGADAYDSANIRALLSFAFGCISQQSAGLGDTAINGVL